MSLDIQKNVMTNVPTQEKKNQNFPFMYFGHRLWRLREKRNIKSSQMAEFLGVSTSEYRSYEFGERIPDRQTLIKLARTLEVDVSKLLQWSVYASRKLEDAPLEGAMALHKEFDLAVERLLEEYRQFYFTPENKTDLELIRRVSENIKKDVSRTFYLPAMPMSLLMITSALDEAEHDVQFIHEINDFALDRESFAGFMSRDPYMSLFSHYVANLLYFHDSPSKNIQDTFNRLTLEQVKEIVLLATHKHAVYPTDEDLPLLQQQMEFGSVAALMVREMKKILPDSINYENLYQTALMQCVGSYLLYVLIQPSLKGRGEENLPQAPSFYAGITSQIMELMTHHLHPVVSAMIGANWGLDNDVIKALIEHHAQPTQKVSPLCAALKLVNYYTDCDFETIGEKDFAEILTKYPQLSITAEDMLKVSTRMNILRDNLVERSSTLVENSSDLANKVYQERLKKIKTNASYGITPSVAILRPPKRSEFRFDQEYQKAMVQETLGRLNDLRMQMMSPQKQEGLANFEKRIGNLYLKLDYITTKDLQAVAEKFKLSPDEVKIRLKG